MEVPPRPPQKTKRTIARVAILVRDYDEALSFYRDALGFRLIEDTRLSRLKRWVIVAPSVDAECAILLAKADGPAQQAAIGNQAGGRVAFFLHTDDIARDHASMTAKGVHFLEDIRTEPYGRVAVFEDLYGNRWDLLQPSVDKAPAASREA